MAWGLSFPIDGIPLAAQRGIVEALPDLGFTELWSSERGGSDGFTPLALASVWAPGLRLGTAVTPVHTRGPALIAMQAAGLAEAAPGRFSLGLGASSRVIVERWNGLDFDRPFYRCRDLLRFLPEAFTGASVTAQYDTFRVERFRLERVPDPAPPVLLAALRPGMLRLAAREADGVILNWLAAGDLPRVLGEFRVPAGRPAKRAVVRVFVCPTDDLSYARAVGRRHITSYLTVPTYAEYQRWLGRGALLTGMWQAWEAGDRQAALAAVPDEVVDDLIVHGSPEECRARLARFTQHRAGGVAVVVAPSLLPTPQMARASGDPSAALDAVKALAPLG